MTEGELAEIMFAEIIRQCGPHSADDLSDAQDRTNVLTYGEPLDLRQLASVLIVTLWGDSKIAAADILGSCRSSLPGEPKIDWSRTRRLWEEQR